MRADAITDAIKALIEEGVQLTKLDENRALMAYKYEPWYTKALMVVRQVIPEREDDFREAYKLEKRKELNVETYTISDFLLGLDAAIGEEEPFDSRSIYVSKVVHQVAILKAALAAAPSVLGEMRAELRAELVEEDVRAAKELLEGDHTRGAGVICGVVLEAHLRSVAARHGIKLRKKQPDISDWNDALKESEIVDVPMWRLIQYLAGLWDVCMHEHDREPTQDEVTDLIDGIEKVTREVF
jgi:hypothetical protein